MIKAPQRGTFSTRPLSLPNCYPAPADAQPPQMSANAALRTANGLAGRTAGTSIRLPSVPGLTTRLMYGQRERSHPPALLECLCSPVPAPEVAISAAAWGTTL